MEVVKLETELGELFDIRTAKIRREKNIMAQAREAQKEIRLLILMFYEGDIPSLTVALGDDEFLEWDPQAKRLIYCSPDAHQYLETVKFDTLVRIRPYLHELVKKAKQLFED